MVRKYVDLHIRSNLSSGSSSIHDIIGMAVKLGFNYIGLADFNRENINQVKELKKTFSEYGVDMVSRVDLFAQNIDDLKKDLRFFRGKIEIISVFCNNLSIARFAARDRRVDVLNFLFNDWKNNFFDVSEAKLSAENNTALEINIADIIRCSYTNERIKMLKIISENIKTALKYNVPVIFSSGAKNVFEMRGPKAMASLSILFGASEFDALNFVSNFPLQLIIENREKLEGKMIYQGVRLLRGSENNGKIEKK